METGILIALIVIGIVWWIGAAILCAVVAEEKGRSVGAWFLAGLFFSFVALIALAAMPNPAVVIREPAANQPVTSGSARSPVRPRAGSPVDRYLKQTGMTREQKRREVSRRSWTMKPIKDRDET